MLHLFNIHFKRFTELIKIWKRQCIKCLQISKCAICVICKCRGVARGILGCSWPPLGRPSFEQTTYFIQVAKKPWQNLGRKSYCWKAHVFKICFFVKYFRQRLLSLVNMGLHAAIIRLSPLIHEGEQRYKPYIVGDPRMVSLLNITNSLCNPPPPLPLWKILATPLCTCKSSFAKIYTLIRNQSVNLRFIEISPSL